MNNINQKNNNTAIRFLGAQTISLLGSSLVQYAIIWYITLSTSSGAMLTISTICGFAPQILISLFGGAILDRYNRRTVIMITDGIIALSTLLLGILFLTGNNSLFVVFCVLAVRSAGTGIQAPAVQSVLPQITPSDKLMRVNGIYSTLSSVTMFLSPAISGAILSVSTIEVTLFIDVITAIIGILITLTVSIPYVKGKGEKKKSSVISDIKEGISYTLKHSFIRRLFIFQAVLLFLISPSAFLTPLMVSRSFGAEVWRLTASEMTYSVGCILGGVIISALGAKKTSIVSKNKLWTVVIAGFLYGICMTGMGLAPLFIIYLIINTLIGITSPCYNTPLNVLVQENVQPQMHGRVFGFMQMASSCALPLGMALFGPLADIFSVQQLLLTCGVLAVIATVIMAVASRKKAQ